MRALITGGAGFIGSNLVDALVERGDEAYVIDNLSTGKRENLDSALEKGAELTVADTCDRTAMSELLERIDPETVFHLAAQIDVRKAVADPAFDARVNVEGTINVLEASRLAGVKRFVNISTGGAIYGEPDQIPAPGSAPVKPLAPYGQSKFAAEGYCELYRRIHELSTVSLRLGNVYGPRQDPLGEAGVIAIFCGKLRAGERPTVYGDGEQTRDYVYVADIVEAFLAAAATEVGGSFNIGSGNETSVLDLIEILSKHTDSNFDPELAAERKGEVQRISLDPSEAGEKLGWHATTNLVEGIKRTLESV